MHASLAERTYQGEFSYYHGGELASLSIAHAVIDGVRHERLIHLNGHPREVVRTGDKVTCVLHPGDRLIDLESSVPAGPFAQSFGGVQPGLPAGYRARIAGEGRIAGRTAVALHIDPERGDRYGYRLWLDRDTALLLRSELLDRDGEPLEIFQFVRIEIDGPIDAAVLQASTGEHLVKHDLLKHDLAAADRVEAPASPVGRATPDVPATAVAWEAGWLPAGFTMASADMRRVPARNDAVASLVYSDGMASFSVFLERAQAATASLPAATVRVARHGATVAVMRPVQAATAEPWLVTVVGEVPVETAQRVAQHVRPRGPGDR